VRLCLSAPLLAEVRDVLTRAEVRAKFPALVPEAVDAFIEDIAGLASLYDAVPAIFTWPAHPDDDHLFDLAIHAQARYLVTSETRILNLATASTPAAQTLRQLAPDLAILDPKSFAELIRAGLSERKPQ
jgi:predicted nucleic acid-binding protein